jgi:hypothetical protein
LAGRRNAITATKALIRPAMPTTYCQFFLSHIFPCCACSPFALTEIPPGCENKGGEGWYGSRACRGWGDVTAFEIDLWQCAGRRVVAIETLSPKTLRCVHWSVAESFRCTGASGSPQPRCYPQTSLTGKEGYTHDPQVSRVVATSQSLRQLPDGCWVSWSRQ